MSFTSRDQPDVRVTILVAEPSELKAQLRVRAADSAAGMVVYHKQASPVQIDEVITKLTRALLESS
jgi:hypothetical protein